MSLCAAFSWVELVLCHIVRVYCQNYDCVLRKQWSSISCLSLIQYLLSFACFIVSPTISVSATARKRRQTHWHSFVRLQWSPIFPLRSANEFTRRIFWYVMRCPSPGQCSSSAVPRICHLREFWIKCDQNIIYNNNFRHLAALVSIT